jgi:endonuclease/exonuclease/phosphatase family metal-dependent hydrolase
MRLASYNLENLFERPKALRGDPAKNAPVLDAFARVSALLMKETYTEEDKAEIIRGLVTLDLENSDEGDYVTLRQSREDLVRRNAAGLQVVASGRSSWIGNLELRRETVDEIGTRNTARVIRDVHADVIATIEVEGRTALSHFNRELIADGSHRYGHVMAITGNDERGITVGVLTAAEYPINDIVSHVDDVDDKGVIFSRDCAEYRINTPSGETLLVMVNHLKSAGFGSQESNDAKRYRQAERVAAIYRERRAANVAHIAVVGDFNAVPDDASLTPLVTGTDLIDISEHDRFDTGALDGDPELIGTWGSGTRPKKLDYILLSPALYDRASSGGVWRKGVWSSTKTKVWATYDGIENPEQAASDHAAIWADLDV